MIKFLFFLMLFNPSFIFANDLFPLHHKNSIHLKTLNRNRVKATINSREPFQIGKTLSAHLHLKDRATKTPLTQNELLEAHTQKIHILIFDKTLEDYQHVHPKSTATAGDYEFSWKPKKSGPYRFWIDIVPARTGVQQLIKVDLFQACFPENVRPIKTLSRKATVDGLTYRLSFDQSCLKKGKAVMGTVDITQQDGKPFTQLEPIMGTFAHIVALHEDFKTLEHIHPMGMENPPADGRGGPKLHFHMKISKRGFLKIYVQVKINGTEHFIPFGVEIE